ncbi:MAG: SOS response-associated peptidase [Propionibacteriaceae bacterium]|nr:SOS response-associated peptidase [Propionibacteriaceae bacterium]
MCGRFAYPGDDQVIAAFDVEMVSASTPACENVRPTSTVAVITEGTPGEPPDGAASLEGNPTTTEDTVLSAKEPRRILRHARWGLIPSWTKTLDKRFLLINARAETVLSKPSFRVAARSRRAIVPASGYYEWMKNPDGTKTPFFLHARDETVLGFAGLYEWWKVPGGVELRGAEDGWLCSVTIITRSATDSLGHIHDRMPVIVPPASVGTWLDPELSDRDEVDAVLNSLPEVALIPTERAPS